MEKGNTRCTKKAVSCKMEDILMKSLVNVRGLIIEYVNPLFLIKICCNLHEIKSIEEIIKRRMWSLWSFVVRIKNE